MSFLTGLLRSGARPLWRSQADHWSFLFSQIAVYSFVVALVTGVFLFIFFKPSMTGVIYHGSYHKLSGVRMSEAYKSALEISFDVRGGLRGAAQPVSLNAGCLLRRCIRGGLVL